MSKLAIVLLVAAVAADTATYLVMGPEHEGNPLVRGLGPVVAMGIRWAGVALLIVVRPLLRHPRRWLLTGAYLSAAGAVSNLYVLGSIR